MTPRRPGRVIALTLAFVASMGLSAKAPESAYFPEGYSRWRVAKFKLIGPDSPNYEKQGGFRHHFANDRALASWGKFQDGAVIVDERVLAALDEHGVWRAGKLASVAVMRKDSRRFRDTGGWYFNIFSANDTAVGLTPIQAKAACFDACHKAQAERDFVFSDPRP